MTAALTPEEDDLLTLELIQHSRARERLADPWDIGVALEFTLGAAGPVDPTQERWQELALCATTDPELFFPEKGGSTREAKRVCAKCPVRETCLEAAMDRDERFGIWGGLSERERRRLKIQRLGKQVPRHLLPDGEVDLNDDESEVG